MSLQKSQLFSIAGFILLLLFILGLRTKPYDLIEREKNRSLNLQSTDVTILKREAEPTLNENTKSRIQILEAQLKNVDGEEKIELLRNLSAVWYDAGEIGISGYYAEQVASLSEDAASWGIAGTTYALCLKRSSKDKEKILCLDKALMSIENAISLDPDEMSYQINRAVILAENPPAENPMRGVMLLLDLNKKFPKNVSVINNIAKFALQTNQFDKAEQRLLGALELDPNNITTNCLLVQLYMAKGENDRALNYQQNCK